MELPALRHVVGKAKGRGFQPWGVGRPRARLLSICAVTRRPGLGVDRVKGIVIETIDDYVRAGSRLASAAESSDRDAMPSFGNTR